MWTQFTKATKALEKKDPKITLRRKATYKNQVRYLGFLEPYQKKKPRKRKPVSVY